MNKIDRKEIAEYIENRCNFLLRDTNTFVWAKTNVSQTFDLDYDHCNIGGGNMLMVHGLLAIINYLAKIYYILNKGDKLRDEEKEKFLIEHLKTKLEYKGKELKINEYFLLKPYINETNAFTYFISESPVDWCLGKDEPKTVWNFYRNKLAHLALPRAMVRADGAADESYCTRKEKIARSEGKAFTKVNDKYECNADLLQRDTEILINFVCTAIQNADKFSEERIGELLEWYKKEDQR